MQVLSSLLPASLQAKVPGRAPANAHRWPTREHDRKVLMLMGCVQPTLMPNINSATARVLDAAGIQTVVADDAGCCGALRTHLADRDGGLADMRRNIDAWWPLVEGLTSQGQVEAIVMNASGCGVTVKDYGHALAHDPDYADKAAQISRLTRDVSELLPELLPTLRGRLGQKRVGAAQAATGGAIDPFVFRLAIFVLAWIGQFVGHHVEGRKPSFLEDVSFLLIGPAWLLADVYRRAGIRY